MTTNPLHDDKLLQEAFAELWRAIEDTPEHLLRAYDRVADDVLKCGPALGPDDLVICSPLRIALAELGLIRLLLARRNADIRHWNRRYVADIETKWSAPAEEDDEHDHVDVDPDESPA